MKSRMFLPLVLILILVTSLALIGCECVQPFSIVSCNVSSSSVDVSSPVTISAVINNPCNPAGPVNVTIPITISINGSSVETRSVNVAGKGRQNVTFNYTPQTEGEYTVCIGYRCCIFETITTQSGQ
jgi:hypothetical protein